AKRANFAVLRETNMPAVLIEYGFISNLNDEKIIANEIEKQAQLTFEGINSYLGIKASTTAQKVEGKGVRKLDINSPSLNELAKSILDSKAQREIIVNYAVAE